MLIREAMSVFWQTLKDVWEELYSIGMVNLVWLFAWALPAGIVLGTGIEVLIIPAIILSVGLFTVTTSGVYYVANRVAHGKTFHFVDFVDGIKKLWWRSLIWGVVNIIVVYMIYLNLQFYPQMIKSNWVILIGGFWVSVLVFWTVMQIYFWPLLVEQEETKMLLAWRNAAYLILVNPFYAFFVTSFAVLLLAISVGTTLPFVFIGMGVQALLGSNAALTLLYKVGVTEDPRPKPGQ